MAAVRILLVDDVAPFLSYVRSILEEHPEWKIVGEAGDGITALRMAAELRPDVICLDMELPGLNGIEVARRIRENTPSAKILFVSATRFSEMAQEALRMGANGYVVKKDAANELLTAVEAVLRGELFVSSSFFGR